MAIFEHRPARDSANRRQADLSLEDEPSEASDGLLDLPLDGGAAEPEIRPSAMETVPIPTSQPTASPVVPPGGRSSSALLLPDPAPPADQLPERRRPAPRRDGGAAGWGPTVRTAKGRPPSATLPATPPPAIPPSRRRPETIGQAGRGGRWLWVLLLLGLPLALVAGYFLNRAPAVAALSSEMVDFGTLRLGETSQQAFEISNQGQRELQIQAFEVMGDAAEDFQVAGEDCLERPLAQGDQCRVRLAFRPSVSGDRRSRLAVRSTSVEGLRTLPLLGGGAAPRLESTPPEVEFGEHVVGAATSPQVIWLSNGGSAPLTVERVRLGGLAAADFVLRRDECSRQQLAPGARCALRWTFVPTSVGPRRATVEVISDADNAADSNTRSTLTGVGLPQEPELRLTPERLQLAATALGEVSGPAELEIFNDGNGALQIHDLRPPTEGTPGSEVFRLVQENCTEQDVAPGQSCRVQLVFAPNREGEVSAFFEVLHSAGEGRHLLPLVGEGLAPRLSLEPRRLTFGEAPVGELSAGRSLRVVSDGSAALQVIDVKVTGADAGAFEVVPVSCLDTPLESGRSCAFDVRFRPRRDGPHRAELVLRHNADGGAERLPLNGIGTSPKLTVDVAQVDFGNVQAGQQAERSLTLSNSGRAPLEVRRVRLGAAEGLSLADDKCSGRRLEPGSRCQVRLLYGPSRQGQLVTDLRVEHSAGGRTLEIPLRARAAAPPPPRLGLNPQRFDFAPQGVGGSSRIQTLILRNAGQGQLMVRGIELVGPQADGFQLVPGTCAEGRPLPPREECTVGVRFAPLRAGNFEATIEIRHNGPEGTQRVPLAGRASAGAAAP